MSCPICEKRPAKRFCPAMGEKICAVCCGREREVTIDCLADCPHLIAAHRWELEHRKPIPAEDFPYRDIEFPADFVYERWPLVTGLATTILAYQHQNKDLNDGAVQGALEALAETHRTLDTGIYYERPPDAPLARALYSEIAQFLRNFRKDQAERTGSASLRDSEIFRLIVFLLRMCKQESSGRPRSRAFLRFLSERFPLPAGTVEEAPRIIP